MKKKRWSKISEEYEDLEDSDVDDEIDDDIEDEISDIEEEFEPTDINDETDEEIDNEFEPHDEKEIDDNLDQNDFEPLDPGDKDSLGEEQKIENDKPNNQVNETPDYKINIQDKDPPDNPPKDKGNTIINVSQQPEKNKIPEKQPKPPKSGESLLDKLNRGIADFIQGFKKFFVKSDEEINKELLKKQYKKSIYEK